MVLTLITSLDVAAAVALLAACGVVLPLVDAHHFASCIISFCMFGQLIVVYTCTEDIEANGQILAYEIHPDGSLTEIGRVDAGEKTTAHEPPAEYDHLVIDIYGSLTPDRKSVV